MATNMAAPGGADQGVEDLVVAEHRRVRVGSAAVERDGADDDQY
jgi:hypothetical protein